jgi:hypothetical protein
MLNGFGLRRRLGRDDVSGSGFPVSKLKRLLLLSVGGLALLSAVSQAMAAEFTNNGLSGNYDDASTWAADGSLGAPTGNDTVTITSGEVAIGDNNIPSSVTTTPWIIVHVAAMGTSLFGLLGVAGLYARQAEKSGWLGLAGYLLLSLWLALILGFTFVEVFALPVLTTAAPTFVAGWLGMFTGTASEIDLGPLPILWTLTGPIYILGGLLFGIATFRARVLPRWAGVLLAVGTTIGPAAALLPLEYQPKVAVPVGLALAWLGYALWSERKKTPA